MPFDVADEFIQEMEKKLGVTFPAIFHKEMCRMNGGNFDGWELYPVADSSTRERSVVTHNDIIFETREAQDWDGLPEGVIALAGDGFGDQVVVLVNNEKGTVGDEVSAWSHETGAFTVLASSWEAFFRMRDGHGANHLAETSTSIL